MADVKRKVGRFEIVREVGRGGMAVVYLARQSDLDRLVALKELPAFHAADSDFAERFLRESRIAGSLSHPNIVTVHDYFDVEGTPYISMEYLERGSLRPHMRDMTLPQVAGVLEGLLAALDHAHARGIVHRDLKPENLLLTRQGSVKVADFGIAKAIGQASQVHMLTATGTTVGTPTYMAPEQAMARDIGPATDLYSVGVIAYEMLVGKVPFANAETPLAVLLQHVNEPPPPPRSIRPDLDPRLAHWVEALLEKDPRSRPPSAEAAWDAFEENVLSLSGPRWRRDARLLDPGEAGPPKPLTPAPFPLPVDEPGAAGGSGFVTYGPGDTAPPPAQASPAPASAPAPPPPAAEPTPVPAPPPPAAEPPAVETPAALQAAPLPIPAPPVGDDYRTFDPARVPDAAAATTGHSAPPAAVPPGGELPIPAPAVGDGYRTFEPPPVPEPPKSPPPPPPPPPAPAPEPEAVPEPEQPAQLVLAVPEPGVSGPARAEEPEPLPAPADRQTLAPAGVPVGQSFEWPAARPREKATKGKVPLAAWLGLLVVGGGGIAAAAAFLSGGGGKQEPASSGAHTTPAPAPPADVTVPPQQQVGLLAAAGGLYVATPRGYVVRLSAKTLAPAASLRDGSAPRSLAVSRGRLFVVGTGTVTALAAGTLAPIAAAAFPGASLLAGGGGAPVVAAGSKRVCVVDPRPVACASLTFTPSGVGVVRADSSVVVADSAGGAIVHLRRAGSTLAAAPSIAVGKEPHGSMLSFRGKLYVAVRRGIAVVDLKGAATTTTIPLRTSAADIWISPAGRLFATLPASDRVAIIDLASPRPAARLVAVGHQPQGIAGAGATVYVANAGARTVTLLSAVTGAAAGAPRPVAALRAPVARRALAVSVAHQANATAVTFTVAVSGGPLAQRDVVSSGARIGTGSARILVWQGGAGTRVRMSSAGGATLRIDKAAGHLVLALSAAAKTFTSLRASLARGGTRLVIRLERAPAVTPTPTPPSPSPTPPQPTPSPSPSPPPPSSTPSTTPPPPPPQIG